jgi:hypothetical protein
VSAQAYRTLRGRLRVLPRVGRGIASAVGLTATVIGIVFVLWPSLKPDPPPVDKGASLSHAQVDSGLSFGQYLDRIEQSRKPYGPADLARRGV